MDFDVVVVGSGPGGYVAAIRAAQLGLKTAVIEKEHLGGICLNWGCIPTKALLRSAEVYRLMQHAKAYGLSAEKIAFDLSAVVERSRTVSKRLSGGVEGLLKKNKVQVFMGQGSLLGGGKVDVLVNGKSTHVLSGKHIILATGARARILEGFEPDGQFVWTYKEALVPKKMPKNLLVIGSGAIGIEFANFYNAFGANVTVAEFQDRIMPVEDAEISAIAHKSFEKQGISIRVGTTVTKLVKGKDSVTATLQDGAGKTTELMVDTIISAVGIVANIEHIGLEKTKIKTENGRIVTDAYSLTAEPGVYAIGDITKGPWLAHKASHEGIICVEKFAGVHDVHPLDPLLIPGCTYTHPQVASVGLTEAKARALGHTVKVGKFPFLANGKAIALGEEEGMIKTVFDAKTGQLLGAHLIGAEVTELVQGYAIAMGLETTELELMHTVFPHPTLSEMMHESALAAYGRAIHI